MAFSKSTRNDSSSAKNISSWLKRETFPIRNALETASKHFDKLRKPETMLIKFPPDENGGFTLQMIVDSGPEKESAQVRRQLQGKSFLPYWL